MVQLTYLAVERHNHAQSLIYAARHDPLTGLANRTAFMEGVRGRLADRLHTTGVLYLDLDEFKAVNDGHDHHHGDAVLRAVADRLGGVVGSEHLLGRLGGDEFAVCTADLDVDDLIRLADAVIEALQAPIVVEDRCHEVGATIGISLADPSGPRIFTTDELVSAADRALLQAKASSKGRWNLADYLR
jgi:diguanylate cyclase (GGDEF)-like protein